MNLGSGPTFGFSGLTITISARAVVPTVSYATLPQFIYGIASTASETFPQANSQPYNFLNLDVYAQDTWKITKTLTWTFGLRATHNSNPVNPHDAVARLPGSWDAISHNVDQPLDARSRQAWEHFRIDAAGDHATSNGACLAGGTKTVLRTGFGYSATSCREAWWIWWGPIRRTQRHFSAGCWARRADRTIDSAIAATVAANQTFTSGFAQGQFSCASALSNPATCLQPVAITAVPDGKLHAPYFMQWSFALEQQIGTTMNLRAQYVGTRAVNQPYETQVNGYQTVCQGCFAPFPYGQPPDARFGAVTQLSTGANSHYNGLQLTADKRLRTGCRCWRITLGAVVWTRFRTADSCRFPPEESSRRCPANWGGNTVLAITMSEAISPRNTSIGCRLKRGAER